MLLSATTPDHLNHLSREVLLINGQQSQYLSRSLDKFNVRILEEYELDDLFGNDPLSVLFFGKPLCTLVLIIVPASYHGVPNLVVDLLQLIDTSDSFLKEWTS
jgi:hypothetical protein